MDQPTDQRTDGHTKTNFIGPFRLPPGFQSCHSYSNNSLIFKLAIMLKYSNEYQQ